MDYPFWEVPFLSGGIVIALIAVVHVFVSHFAVGGALFLALSERKALREENRELLSYLRGHSRFFILVTLVFGVVTGVGIWFAIGLAHPAGTSLLIHSFVWAWAMEWCVFLVEIAAGLIYYYGWDRLEPRTHLWIAWIYAVAAYLSLVIINGILAFMLTPGRWIQTGNFWHGLINPSYAPSLLLRTGASISLAGLYALLTASVIHHPGARGRLVRHAARWVLAGFGIMPLAGIWYFLVIPPEGRLLAFGGAPAVTIFLALSVGISAFILVFSWLTAYRLPERFSPALAVLFLLVGLAVTASAEWVREAVRKPFIVYGVMYSNGIRPGQVDELSRDGLLPRARWVTVHEVTGSNTLEAGAEIFRIQCASCHTTNGYNAIRPLIAGWRKSYIADQLRHLNELKGIMPPFAGTDRERWALAHYLASLWGFSLEDQPILRQEASR